MGKRNVSSAGEQSHHSEKKMSDRGAKLSMRIDTEDFIFLERDDERPSELHEIFVECDCDPD